MNMKHELRKLYHEIGKLERDSHYVSGQVTVNVIRVAISDRKEKIKEIEATGIKIQIEG